MDRKRERSRDRSDRNRDRKRDSGRDRKEKSRSRSRLIDWIRGSTKNKGEHEEKTGEVETRKELQPGQPREELPELPAEVALGELPRQPLQQVQPQEELQRAQQVQAPAEVALGELPRQPLQQVQPQEELQRAQQVQAPAEVALGELAEDRPFHGQFFAQPLQSLQLMQQLMQQAQPSQHEQRVYMIPHLHQQHQLMVPLYSQQPNHHVQYHHHQLHPHQQQYWQHPQQQYYSLLNQGLFHFAQPNPAPHHAHLPQVYADRPAPFPTLPKMEVPVAVEEERKSRPMAKVARSKKTSASSKPSLLDSEVFAVVASHIIIMGGKKNTVTVGEIRRRNGAPENLDWKEIAELTRHSQVKISAFQKKFVLSGFHLVNNNTDRPRLTISSLMEDDAKMLHSDFNKLMSFLTTDVISAIAISAAGEGIVQHAEVMIQYLACVRKYFRCICCDPKDQKKEECRAPDEAAMRMFSMETHGFGPLAALSVIEKLIFVMSLIKQSGTAPVPAATAAEMTECWDIDSSLLSDNPDDNVIFEKSVHPRIGYVNSIEVSVGEIRRRVYGPEKMTTHFLIAFLRKTKTKNTQTELKEAMSKYGITPSEKSRKDLNSSCFGGLTEQESMAIARETGAALSRLPIKQNLKDRTDAYPEAASCLRLVVDALATAMERVGERPEQRRAETDIDRHILRFAMLTHHFGHSFFASVMKWIQKSLN